MIQRKLLKNQIIHIKLYKNNVMFLLYYVGKQISSIPVNSATVEEHTEGAEVEDASTNKDKESHETIEDTNTIYEDVEFKDIPPDKPTRVNKKYD